MLWWAIVNMNHAEHGTTMQRMLLLHVQNMIVQLFVMLPRSQGTENISMKREKSLDSWVAKS